MMLFEHRIADIPVRKNTLEAILQLPDITGF
jgi:hypothetical protein